VSERIRRGAWVRRRMGQGILLVPLLIALFVVVLGLEVASAASEVSEAERETSVPALAAHDYVLHCAGCHGMTGEGSDAVPSLAEVPLFLDNPRGRRYLLSVPGVAQAPVSDLRLVGLMNWVVEDLLEVSEYTPFDLDEVSEARSRSPLRDPLTERAVLLLEASAASSRSTP
jgi:hypothetical protein